MASSYLDKPETDDEFFDRTGRQRVSVNAKYPLLDYVSAPIEGGLKIDSPKFIYREDKPKETSNEGLINPPEMLPGNRYGQSQNLPQLVTDVQPPPIASPRPFEPTIERPQSDRSTSELPEEPRMMTQQTANPNPRYSMPPVNEIDEPPAINSHDFNEPSPMSPVVPLPELRKRFPAASQIAVTGRDPSGVSSQPRQVRTQATTVQQSMGAISPLLQAEHKTGNRVVVSIPDKKVVVYGPNGSIIKEYPVYIGSAKSPTPRGQFRIMENIKPDPREWFYGPRWLGFARNYDRPGSGSYAGFHGWVYDKDDDLEEAAHPGWKTSTHGCIQMRNPDVADFSQMVGVGDPVTIVDTPITPTAGAIPKVNVAPVSLMGGGI